MQVRLTLNLQSMWYSYSPQLSSNPYHNYSLCVMVGYKSMKRYQPDYYRGFRERLETHFTALAVAIL